MGTADQGRRPLGEDDFGPSAENEELRAAIIEEIGREGKITFRRFMELALYHPQHGYYTAPYREVDLRRDYLTSPEVHPVFGHLIAKQLLEMWQLMGSPHPFDVVEMGAGSGVLCRNILRWAQGRAPDFFGALRYHIVEISPQLMARQRRTIQSVDLYLNKVSWWDPDASLPRDSITGCFVSNELVDSFPVHRLVVEGEALREIYVTWRDGRWVEVLDAPSTPRLEEYFRLVGVRPGRGCRAEVNLAALDWMTMVAQALRRGFILTLDYGYTAEQLYAPWRRDGTLLCFYRHNPSRDPYAHLGHQDMTSHVDFTALMRVGESCGLRTVGLTSQGRFLAALGIGAGLGPAALQGGLSLEEYTARRRAVMELIDPAGLGRITVLIQGKAVEACRLQGLAKGASSCPPEVRQL